MPKPIREAFLLNSDRYEAACDFEVDDGLLRGPSGSGADIPPIFFNVSDRDRNSDVRSRQVDAPDDTIGYGIEIESPQKQFSRI